MLIRSGSYCSRVQSPVGRSTTAWSALSLALALGGFWHSTAQGEPIIYFEPHTGYSESINSNEPGRHAQPSNPPQAAIGGTASRASGEDVTFEVLYADSLFDNGIGFDDDSLGAARQATLEAVLEYVIVVLGEESGAAINVLVHQSEEDGTGARAVGGTFYSSAEGFTNGFAFTHITTGVDPTPVLPDIVVTVDFGYSWNDDHTTQTAAGEFDLFSVLLHEFTHAVGFANLTSEFGVSAVTGTNPGTYGVLAQLTERDDSGTVGEGSSTALWTQSGNSGLYGGSSGPMSNLTNSRLVFNGPLTAAKAGVKPRMYAPDPWDEERSLSHWSFLVGPAVMLPGIAPGSERREYEPFESDALVDLGYSNASGMNALPAANYWSRMLLVGILMILAARLFAKRNA